MTTSLQRIIIFLEFYCIKRLGFYRNALAGIVGKQKAFIVNGAGSFLAASYGGFVYKGCMDAFAASPGHLLSENHMFHLICMIHDYTTTVQ